MSKLFLFVLICLSLDGFSQITSKKKMARAGDNAPAILEWVKSSVKPSTLTKEQEEKILAHLEANTQASKKVLDKYNPEQFEILGLDRYINGYDKSYDKLFTINGKEKFRRIIIRRKQSGN